jgi:hypothetical protein
MGGDGAPPAPEQKGRVVTRIEAAERSAAAASFRKTAEEERRDIAYLKTLPNRADLAYSIRKRQARAKVYDRAAELLERDPLR